MGINTSPLTAIPNFPGFIPATLHDWLFDPSSRLNVSMLVSVIVHALVLFGVTFVLPLPKFNNAAAPLEVVLVNSKSASKPNKADALAQSNLDGGGNTDDKRRAKSPFPLLPEHEQSLDVVNARQKVEQLEQEQKRLMTAIKSKKSINQPDPKTERIEQKQQIPDATDWVQRILQIDRLQAKVDKDHDAYQKRPKRKFVGARTQEYRFSRYIEDWRAKIERIGNLNYPEAAKREKLSGNLLLTVGIKTDGSIESIEIHRSSGKKILDEAAIRIVRLAGQNGFAPLPPDISRDTDILHITRTWMFTRSDELTSQ